MGYHERNTQQEVTMSQTTRPRGRPRAQATDDRILAATLALLGQVGYARMSLDDVAQAAGVTRPTIYLRYPNKAALARAAMASAREGIPLPPSTGDTLTDLAAQLRHFQAGITHPHGLSMIGALLAEEQAMPDLLALYRSEVVQPRHALIRAVLLTAQARGELRPDVDLDLAVAQLLGSYYTLYIEGTPIPADWPERISAQVLDGLRQPPATR
jgi:AcrR family transcriptional regulator